MGLCLPVLGPQRVLDDWVLELALRGRTFRGLGEGLFGMFRFASGDAAHHRALVDRGVLLPWWSDPELGIAFLRPLSGLTHALDFACWPQSSQLMYAHSLVWVGLVIASAWRLYGRLELDPGRTFGATLLFALSPMHGAAAGWLSSRNTLVASCFALCAVSSWVSGSRVRSLVWFVAALLSGEVAVCALAYFVCHTWILDPRPTRARVASLIPVAFVTLAWRGLHLAFGFGARGSGAYLDPLRDPLALLAVLPERLLASLGATVGPLPADLVFAGEPEVARAALVVAVVALVWFCAAVRGVWTSDPVARFWALGSLLAALPLSAAPPNDRGLLLVAVGVKALIVRLAWGIPWRRAGWVLALPLVAWHALGAPVVLAVRAGQFQTLGRLLAESAQVLDSIPELERRSVVVLNPPRDLFASYLQLERAARGAALARHFYWLTSASSSIRVTRTGPNTVEVERAGGFCATPLERLYRRDPKRLSPGTRLDFAAFVAEIVSSRGESGPARVRFRFRVPLEHESLVFLVWRAGRYVRVAPPSLGQSLEFEPQALEQLLSPGSTREQPDEIGRR